MKLFFDALFALCLFVNAILFLPQAYKILKTRKANDISLTTFLGFNFIQLITIIHGLYHNDLILTVGYVASFISCGVVTALIIRYGK